MGLTHLILILILTQIGQVNSMDVIETPNEQSFWKPNCDKNDV